MSATLDTGDAITLASISPQLDWVAIALTTPAVITEWAEVFTVRGEDNRIVIPPSWFGQFLIDVHAGTTWLGPGWGFGGLPAGETDYVLVLRWDSHDPIDLAAFANGTKSPFTSSAANNDPAAPLTGAISSLGDGTVVHWFACGTGAPSDAEVAALDVDSASGTVTAVGTTCEMYLPLTTDVNDASGHARHGATVGTVTFDAPPSTTPPTANAGADKSGTSGGTVSIGGSDTAGTNAITSRAWTQISPPSPSGSFSAPAVATTDWTLPTVTSSTVFVLRKTVSDGTQSSTDDVSVTVVPAAGTAGQGVVVRKNGQWV